MLALLRIFFVTSCLCIVACSSLKRGEGEQAPDGGLDGGDRDASGDGDGDGDGDRPGDGDGDQPGDGDGDGDVTCMPATFDESSFDEACFQ